MPVINGQVCRSRFNSLKIGELSSVDNPAQPGAVATIMKRHDPAITIAEIAKYVCEDDGAHSFTEVLTDNKFSQEIWPYTDALSQSIRSIVGDTSLTGGERETRINASVGEFLAAVRTISPEVEKRLSGLITRKEQTMPKTIEQLEKELGEATTKLAAAEGARDLAIKAKTDMETLLADEKDKTKKAETALAAATAEGGELPTLKAKLATVEGELVTAKAALVVATDETIKVGDEMIKRSDVGDANFKLAKTLSNERTTAQLEKRAEIEFAHVVGTPAEKALVLKVVADRAEDDPTRKALEAVLKSAEKMTQAGFDRLGTGGGETETRKAAKSAWATKVEETRKANPTLKEHQVMSKARRDHPAEFAAFNGDEAAAAN